MANVSEEYLPWEKPMKAMLSIKPEYVDRILSGEKPTSSVDVSSNGQKWIPL